MNLRLKISFALFFLSLCSHAQDSRFEGGIVFGGVTSQVSGDGLGGWNKYGMAAGAWVKMGFSDKWGALISMHYTNKGSAKPADPKNGDNDQFFYKLNYIDIPVMAEYQMDRALFHFGLYAGVLVKQSQEYNGSSSSPSPLFEPLDIGGTLGAGYELNDNWTIELRGQTSIIPTRPSPNPTNTWSYYEQGNYNQVLQLLLSLSF